MRIKLEVVVTTKEEITGEELARIFKRTVEEGIEEMHQRQVRFEHGEPRDHDSKIAQDLSVLVGPPETRPQPGVCPRCETRKAVTIRGLCRTCSGEGE